MNIDSTSLQISRREIGSNFPSLVIVEISINHKGDLITAFKMIDAAYNSEVY